MTPLRASGCDKSGSMMPFLPEKCETVSNNCTTLWKTNLACIDLYDLTGSGAWRRWVLVPDPAA